MSSQVPKSDRSQFDAVFENSRRETLVLLIGFAVFFAWSIGASYVLGYAPTDTPVETVRTVIGMPHWVFWGVAVPWLGANLFTFWFCLFYMSDDPLGESNAATAPDEEWKSTCVDAPKEQA